MWAKISTLLRVLVFEEEGMMRDRPIRYMQ